MRRYWGIFLAGLVVASVLVPAVAHAQLTAAPDPLDFGDVIVTDTSNATVTLTNSTGAAQSIDSCVLTGLAADFAVTSCPSTVPGNGSADVGISFSPGTAGAQTDTLTVNYAGNSKTVVSTVEGNGLAPQLTVAPDPVSFPNTRVCETSTEITVNFENTGDAPLTIDSIDVSNPIFPITTKPPDLPTTLNPTQSISMGLSFSPAQGILYNGTIDVVSDDPNSPTQVNVTGRGGVAALAITPTTSFDFGDVRTDQPPVAQSFTIRNSGQAPVQLQGVSLDDNVNFGLTLPGLPVTLNPAPFGPGGNGQTRTFQIIAQPQSLGAKSATATIQSDLPCGEITTVDVTADGVAPGLELSSGSLDFGGVDVQGGTPALRTVTITNSGTATLSFDDLHLDDPGNIGPYSGNAYTLSSSSPISVPPLTSVLITTEYLPAVAGNDAAVLVLDGDLRADIPLDGAGIDRFITAPRTLEFSPTFRNPEQPTTADLIVTNTGQAPLAISAAMAEDGDTPDPGQVCGTGSPFSVQTPPMIVGPGASETIVVEFSPERISSSPLPGQLIIVNDDDNEPMFRVDLSGVAFLPELSISPDRVDFGTIGAGLTTEITGDAQRLRIVNTEDTPLVVRELQIVGTNVQTMDGIIELADFEGPVTIAPNDALEVDFEFAPPDVGDYAAQLLVFTGVDPCEVKVIDMQGRAIDLRLRGGGCSAAGDAGTGAGFALAFALLLWLARRRRCVAIGCALVAVALGANVASAQPTRNIDIANFRPAPGIESEHITVETPRVGRSGAWSVALVLNHAVNPLHAESPDASAEGMTDALVAGSTGAEVLASYAFAERYEVGLGILAMRQTGDAPSFSGIQPAEGAALGDIAVHARMHIVDAEPLAFAASLGGTVPTGNDEQFAGVDSPTAHARGIVGLRTRLVRVAGNVGARLRAKGELADVSQGHELTYGASGAVRVHQTVSVIGELYGAIGLGEGGTGGTSPLEALVGARYRLNDELGLVGGLGRGVLAGIGAPDLRAFVLVSYAQGARGVESIAAPPKFVDRRDSDGDKILNFEDSCPNDAEDFDSYEDKDGCPEEDNDGDGLPDKLDRCPMEAEDRDGFEDSDGCPDTDNDKDNVVDSEDQCPDEPEDIDQFEDDDGCDDPDNDKDGILDLMDGCVLEPETINGNSDDDGCPDAGESDIMLMADRIELLNPVTFKGTSDRLTTKSRSVLAQIGAVMRADRDIVRIRVGVHVHKRGKNDLVLSKRRAAAVKQFLIDWGVESERIELKGWGSIKPLVTGRGKKAVRANDRVEIVLMERRNQRRKSRPKPKTRNKPKTR